MVKMKSFSLFPAAIVVPQHGPLVVEGAAPVRVREFGIDWDMYELRTVREHTKGVYDVSVLVAILRTIRSVQGGKFTRQTDTLYLRGVLVGSIQWVDGIAMLSLTVGFDELAPASVDQTQLARFNEGLKTVRTALRLLGAK